PAVQPAPEAVTAAEAARTQAEAGLAQSRAQAAEAEAAATKSNAEYDALAAILAQKFGREGTPVLDELQVPDGLETALGAALREELSASADAGASRHWRQLPDLELATASLKSFAQIV